MPAAARASRGSRPGSSPFDCVAVNAGDAFNGADAHVFAEQGHRLHLLF